MSLDKVTEGEAGAYESIPVSTSAIGFTSSIRTAPSAIGLIKAAKAVFKVETNPIRFTLDGTTPVATTTGTLGSVGDVITIEGKENVENFLAIREGGADGVIKPTYFR